MLNRFFSFWLINIDTAILGQVMVMVVMVVSACCVTARAVRAESRQAPGVSERDEAPAAPRLAFMVFVTQVAIAAIQIIPNVAVRHTHGHFETRQFLVLCLVPIECLSPG